MIKPTSNRAFLKVSEKMVATVMQRDNFDLLQNKRFVIAIDGLTIVAEMVIGFPPTIWVFVPVVSLSTKEKLGWANGMESECVWSFL